MEIWETLTMSRKEVPRAGLLKAALAGRITNAEGARALQLSVRQFQRLKRRFAAEGAAGLRHLLRARLSPRRLAGPLVSGWPVAPGSVRRPQRPPCDGETSFNQVTILR